VRSSDRREERERAEATLATVDAALEARSASEDGEHERELGQLALVLRSGAPEPSATFAAALEERVWAGFAEDRRAPTDAPTHRKGPARRWPLSLNPVAAGATATVILGLVVAAGVLNSGDRGSPDGIVGVRGDGGGAGSAPTAPDGEVGSLEAEPSVKGRALSGDSAAPVTGAPLPVLPSPDGGSGFAPDQTQRRIERAALLTLAAPEDRVDAVSQGIVAATERHRGYLVGSSTFSGEDAPAGGSFDLRVPVGELRATLTDLAALGTVRAQSQTGQDLTEAVATAADRLDGARADRRGLLRRLERADSDRQARALRRQLELVSGEIRGLRGQLEALEERTDFARVAVTLTDESSSGAAGTPSSTESALDDALGSLVGAFNFLVRALGILLPIAVVAALAWLAFAALRRRRREAVLR